MPKFKVKLIRRLYQLGEVEVAAENHQEAYILADRAVSNGGFLSTNPDIVWEDVKECGEFDVDWDFAPDAEEDEDDKRLSLFEQMLEDRKGDWIE